MTNEEKWANTLEKLHGIEPAPFNPNYNKMAELQAKFMRKIKKELVKLDDNDIHGASGVCNNIEDLCYITLSAVLGLNGYSVVNGELTHKTEKGKEYIRKTFNT